jgi:hypothetical protein
MRGLVQLAGGSRRAGIAWDFSGLAPRARGEVFIGAGGGGALLAIRRSSGEGRRDQAGTVCPRPVASGREPLRAVGWRSGGHAGVERRPREAAPFGVLGVFCGRRLLGFLQAGGSGGRWSGKTTSGSGIRAGGCGQPGVRIRQGASAGAA